MAKEQGTIHSACVVAVSPRQALAHNRRGKAGESLSLRAPITPPCHMHERVPVRCRRRMGEASYTTPPVLSSAAWNMTNAVQVQAEKGRSRTRAVRASNPAACTPRRLKTKEPVCRA
ncbi:hypothetical protein DDE01_03170 [Desulfovibrio desulfuricans]|nr:hypothetical protein DDE01_03170 [Desulfovibrio desulfuricans]